MSNIQAHEVGKSGRTYLIASGDASSAIQIPGHGTTVMLQAEGQAIRYTLASDQTPTTTFGFRIGVNETHTLNLAHGEIIKVIETAASASINVNWLK